jgi:hypothetical protein
MVVGHVKKKALKVLVIAMIIAVILPAIAYVANYAIITRNQNQRNHMETPSKITITLPFKPGDTFTLQYILTSSNGNNTIILANHTATFRIQAIQPPYIVTDRGLVPIEMIYPITYKVYPLNPHYLYYSFYFNDWTCLILSNVTEDGKIPAYPKPGCVKFTGDVVIDEKGVLRRAKLVITTGKGLIMEYMYMVAYTSSGETKVSLTPLSFLCYGPYSPDITFTAPGEYVVVGGKLVYKGGSKVPNTTKPVIILAKDDTGRKVWYNLTSSGILPDGTIIFVKSNLIPVSINETDVLVINGSIVAKGLNIIDWVREHNG